MPRKFLDLDVQEISSVDRPANKRKYLVIKAAAKELEIDVSDTTQKMYGPMTPDEIQAHEEALQAWYQLWGYFMRSVDSIMCADEDEDGIDKPAMLREAVDQFATKARELLATMGGDREKRATERLEQLVTIAKQGRKLSADRMRRLKEAMALLDTIMHEGMGPEEEGMEKVDDLTKRVTELETAHAALQTEHTTLKAAHAALQTENATLKCDLAKAVMTPEEQEAEYLKGLPDVIRKQYEADKLEKAELRKKLQEAEDRNTKQEYIAKAAGYKALPINPDDDWDVVFKAIAGLPEKSSTRIEQLFKSAEELCAEAKVFEAVGTGGGGSLGGSSAYTQLEALAGELQKGTKMTKAQAVVKAIDARPDLAKQHRDERKEARNGR